MWAYLFGRPHGHLGYLMWTPLDLSFDHLTGLLNQVRRASPLSNCQRLDYPTALDLAKFLREQFPRVVRGAVTLVNNMAQTGPSRDAEEEFTTPAQLIQVPPSAAVVAIVFLPVQVRWSICSKGFQKR